jgi:DNA-binding transcriptional LysR family regulator
MDVARLNLLRELAERGSIAEVAKATHRTASGISQQLRKLEAEAGLPLTEKVGRGLALTDAGRALARSAADVAQALERAEAVWHEFRNDPTGTVSVATFPTGGQMLLPGLLRRVAEIGGLTVNCSDQDPESQNFASLTADFDIVLGHTSAAGGFRGEGNLVVVPLMTEPLDIALPLNHPLAAREFLVPADLIGEQWIGVPAGFPFERTMNDIFEASGAPATIVQRFGDTRVTESLVAAGLGVAVLPRYTAMGAYPGRLVLKRIEGVAARRHIAILMRPDRAERLAVRTVVEAIRAESAAVLAENTPA